MIEPTDKDIGREVAYRRYDTVERGVIVSFNDRYVFVKYGADNTAKATLRGDLEWRAENLPDARRKPAART
jgi:hypothetical protein